jgi:hypothetical protein
MCQIIFLCKNIARTSIFIIKVCFPAKLLNFGLIASYFLNFLEKTKVVGVFNNICNLFFGNYLRFNAAKANAGGKTQNTGATERNVFKRSPVGSIIGKGLDLDACTVFITMLHPTDEKKTSNDFFAEYCSRFLQTAAS